MKRLIAIAALVFGLVLAGCGGGDDSSSDGAAEPTGAVTAPADGQQHAPDEKAGGGGGKSGLSVKVADSQFGQILFDEEDQAIYLFDKESTDTSECYGECAAAWPPVLTEGEPQAGPGIDSKLLGTTKRDDGATQVTYNGHPLYYYVDDPPGQVLCHNVEEFGGLWLVLTSEGDAVS
jgi:predicted lipoprotein with Yx(FWY)xxD motif